MVTFKDKIKLFIEKEGDVVTDSCGCIFMINLHYATQLKTMVSMIIEEIDDNPLNITIMGDICNPVMVLEEDGFMALIEHYWNCWGQ